MIDEEPKDIITEISHPTTPAPKPITLNLVYYVGVYKVIGMTNSTYYKPGQWMSLAVAQQCCDIKNWTVIIADNHVMATIFGTLQSLFPVTAVPI